MPQALQVEGSARRGVVEMASALPRPGMPLPSQAAEPCPRQLLVTPARVHPLALAWHRAVLKHGWDLVVAHWPRLQAPSAGAQVSKSWSGN